MPLTVRCPGCGSNLSAPDHLAGQAVRCTKCRQPMQLPAVVDAEPVAPARPAPATPIAPPAARPAMKRAAFADEPDDRRPARPEPRRRSKLPVVLLAAGGGLALLLVGAGVLLAVLGDDVPGDVFGGVLADRWTRQTIPGTDCSVEVPGSGDKATASVGNKEWTGTIGMVAGETADGRVVCAASVAGSTENGVPVAGGMPHGWDMTEFLAGLAPLTPGQRLVRRYEVQGRKAALIVAREKDADTVNLYIEDGPRFIHLQAVGQGIDENHPDVKRFIGSVQFASAAATPAAYPPNPTNPSATSPGRWQRVTVPGSALTVEMPTPSRTADRHPRSPWKGTAVDGWFAEFDGSAEGLKFAAVVLADGPNPPGYRPKRTYQIQGREAVLNTFAPPAGTRGPGGVSLHVRLGDGRQAVLTASGAGVTEDTREVKWFVDSVRFEP